jgi:hypothetical protein
VKPSADFDIYSDWKPQAITVAFVAEAPPGNSDGYFYDPEPRPNYAETLRRALFEFLRVEGADTRAKLEMFKGRGYILLDTVKCRCRKKGDAGQLPTAIIRTCAGTWLGRELEEVGSPAPICLLGRAALRGLAEVPGFEALSALTIDRDAPAIPGQRSHRATLVGAVGAPVAGC